MKRISREDDRMPGRTDILDQHESLRTPFAGALALHLAVVGAVLLATYLANRGRESMGDPNSFGGAGVLVTPVASIPLPSRGGLKNQVANDTESNIPQPPKEQKKAPPKEDPDAIAIKGRKVPKRQSDIAASQQKYRPRPDDKTNQLYSSEGQALSSPMFGGMTGAGGVGVGRGSPFGNRFGAYAQLVRDRVAQKWRTQDVDPRIQTAPPTVVLFDIQRNGDVRDVRFLQRSGISPLDYSAQRAVLDAGPFPPLPAGYERDSATVELWFQLKR